MKVIEFLLNNINILVFLVAMIYLSPDLKKMVNKKNINEYPKQVKYKIYIYILSLIILLSFFIYFYIKNAKNNIPFIYYFTFCFILLLMISLAMIYNIYSMNCVLDGNCKKLAWVKLFMK